MREVELEDRRGERFAFRGLELGRSEPPPEDLDRWTEVTVWRTEGGSYVGQVDACSRRRGEVTLTRVHPCADAMELVHRLKHQGALSWPALSALEEAADQDPAVDAALELQADPSRVTRIP